MSDARRKVAPAAKANVTPGQAIQVLGVAIISVGVGLSWLWLGVAIFGVGLVLIGTSMELG